MEAFLEANWFGVLLAVAVAFWLWTMLQLSDRDGEKADFGPLDYIRIWPLLLTKRENGKLVRRGFTRREIVGWAIVLAVAILATIFTPARR